MRSQRKSTVVILFRRFANPVDYVSENQVVHVKPDFSENVHNSANQMVMIIIKSNTKIYSLKIGAMWNVKAKVILIVSGATGNLSRPFQIT
jgi:hypothetical protein